MKTCTRCTQVYALSAFYAHPSTKDKLHTWCKNCCRQSAQQNYRPVGQSTGRPRKPIEEAIR